MHMSEITWKRNDAHPRQLQEEATRSPSKGHQRRRRTTILPEHQRVEILADRRRAHIHRTTSCGTVTNVTDFEPSSGPALRARPHRRTGPVSAIQGGLPQGRRGPGPGPERGHRAPHQPGLQQLNDPWKDIDPALPRVPTSRSRWFAWPDFGAFVGFEEGVEASSTSPS